VLNKPIAIGQAVLDLSKLDMYQLYYDKLKGYARDIGGSIEIVGGDTDSLFMKVTDMKVESEFIPRMIQDELLDTSNYDKSHPHFSNKCNSRLGCIKDEAKGRAFVEWILLRPKAYSMLHADGDELKRAKGVRRCTIQKELTHKLYKDSYAQQTCFQHDQRRIGSKLHQLYSMQYKKRTISYYEDKRYWIAKNSSLPYGNHRLEGMLKPQKRQSAAVPIFLQPAAKVSRIDL